MKTARCVINVAACNYAKCKDYNDTVDSTQVESGVINNALKYCADTKAGNSVESYISLASD